eukprot:226401_1
MDVQFLATHLINISELKPLNNSNKRWIIGIVGIPCSGKSVFAEKLCNTVNDIAQKEICEFIGMDGFHISRKNLDCMEDPGLAHRKRGAYWTFDVYAFSDLLKNISANVTFDVICPTFDHSIKDPTPNGKIIKAQHKIVIVEGLYLFLNNIFPWNDIITPYFNEKWYIKCDYKLAEKRIVARHVKSGIVKNKKDGLFRWIDNDKPNGELLIANLDMEQINVIVKSTNNGPQIINIKWDIVSKL